MKTLHISIGDMHHKTAFDVKVKEVTIDTIKEAISKNYRSIVEHIGHVGVGIIRIGGRGVRGEGVLMQWMMAPHSVRIDSLEVECPE